MIVFNKISIPLAHVGYEMIDNQLRWLSMISYPTRARGIIVEYSFKVLHGIVRQTKSLTSSAAAEYLCCRLSFPEFTKHTVLLLLLGVDELSSEGVEPPNRIEQERPRCLFPASMFAVFICCN